MTLEDVDYHYYWTGGVKQPSSESLVAGSACRLRIVTGRDLPTSADQAEAACVAIVGSSSSQ